MTSVNKMKKARNSYNNSALKTKNDRLKRIYFYDASQRQLNKKNVTQS